MAEEHELSQLLPTVNVQQPKDSRPATCDLHRPRRAEDEIYPKGEEQRARASQGSTEMSATKEYIREVVRKSRRDSWTWRNLLAMEDTPDDLKKRQGKRDELLRTIENDKYCVVEGKLTVKALMTSGDDPLSLAIDVINKLHDRAAEHKADTDAFIQLANQVEEFMLRFIDSLKYHDKEREAFSQNPATDVILETAVKRKQKKFFDNPIILDLLKERWYGRGDYLESSRPWWLLLNIWCLFDVVLFPISFLIATVLGKYKNYEKYFKIPYFIFVRDSLSYLTLLGLHLAICLEPSQLPFSGLEWAILVFQLGRLFTEIKQAVDLEERNSYFSDRWNIFDLAILICYFWLILPMRIVTLVVSESVINNRTLQIASFLYGWNTLPLTFRAVGSLLETFKKVGTIQIALFHIIKETTVVVLHFMAITLAFSSTMTKWFVAEIPMVEDTTHACNMTGLYCWWKIASHMGWSLLQLSDGLLFFESTDDFSETLTILLYAGYLVMALVLLINMLIALLSNTYQRVQDNSRNEWAYQKAMTLQTYSKYHCIPVPFNIISITALGLYGLYKKIMGKTDEQNKRTETKPLNLKELVNRYRLKYGDKFPPTQKLDYVCQASEDTKSMVNQVLYRIFTKENGCDKALPPRGQKAWETAKAISVEDCILTCEPSICPNESNRYGARYRTPFSESFPHFEVMILDSGETKFFGIGVVFGDCRTDVFPGFWNGTVGYHTDDRRIFVDFFNTENGKRSSLSDPPDLKSTTDDQMRKLFGFFKTNNSKRTTLSGCAAIRQGDVIRCTVLFEDKEWTKDGKVRVPVVFSENGSRADPDGGLPCIEYDPAASKSLYPYVAFHYKNRILAKMCSREDVDYQDLPMQMMETQIAEIKSELLNMPTKEDILSQDLQLEKVQSEINDVKVKLEEVNRSLEAKFRALHEVLYLRK